jgi:hypothetical protein
MQSAVVLQDVGTEEQLMPCPPKVDATDRFPNTEQNGPPHGVLHIQALFTHTPLLLQSASEEQLVFIFPLGIVVAQRTIGVTIRAVTTTKIIIAAIKFCF